MGSSAKGLETFNQFLEAMPDNPGMAIVLLQHLDLTHKNLMVDLLKKRTKMQVSEVKSNTQVMHNNV